MSFKKLLIISYFLILPFNAFADAEETATAEAERLYKEPDHIVKENLKKLPLCYKAGDIEFIFGIKYKPEMFVAKNTYLLNDHNDLDKYFFARHTIDFNVECHYGHISRGFDAVLLKMTMRNKGVWGDPDSIASTSAIDVKLFDTAAGNHFHGLPRHFIWYRELWMQLELNEVLGLSFGYPITFTLGAFPFLLGRGIALGEAYAVDPDVVGYFSPNAVDQFAFGAKLSGEPLVGCLKYDFYGAILDSKASTIEQTGLKILGQERGKRFDSFRGPGVINYLLAARLKWNAIDTKKMTLNFEPYGLFNASPEQRVEFLGDAKSKLVTLGLACESTVGKFEFGFDTAFNMGAQFVKAWDRNFVKLASDPTTGNLIQVNTQVTNTTTKADVVVTPKNQDLVYSVPNDPAENGQPIFGSTFKNKRTRFTHPYKNEFMGQMFVFDMGYNVFENKKITFALGYASGDKNPNRDHDRVGDSDHDKDYQGFIGLQEIYSGTRVRSAFVLGGQGRIPRLLSFPSNEDQLEDPFVSRVSRFTNLIFVGAGTQLKPACERKFGWKFEPNILFFWQERPTRVFEKINGRTTSKFADNHLGTEFNIFSEAYLIDDLKCFAIAALFVPGRHFHDVAGKPLNRDQQKFLNSQNDTGIPNPKVHREPLLGENNSFFINLGFEYRF